MPSTDELWLGVLQQIADRTAHEMRGALNGVMVNLEVVRARAASTAAPAAAVGSFADTAARQLDLVMEMAEALLALTRAARESDGVSVTLLRVAALLAPVARSEGGSLGVVGAGPDVGNVPLAAPASIIRLVLGAALLSAVQGRAEVLCRVQEADGTLVRIEHMGGATVQPQIAPDILAAAADADVRVRVLEQDISLEFPRVRATRQRTPIA